MATTAFIVDDPGEADGLYTYRWPGSAVLLPTRRPPRRRRGSAPPSHQARPLPPRPGQPPAASPPPAGDPQHGPAYTPAAPHRSPLEAAGGQPAGPHTGRPPTKRARRVQPPPAFSTHGRPTTGRGSARMSTGGPLRGAGLSLAPVPQEAH
ncbi:unnamed protein product [Gadus morhua 'NCC']